MFKRSETNGLRALRLAALMLWAPLCVLAGVTTTTGSKEPAQPAAPAVQAAQTAQTAKAAAYQMRCWQYGKLLFEENLASLPTDGSQYSLKVSGTDRKGHPVYVAETKNATCLIRHASEGRGWSAGAR
jgi:hypothetical protein